MICSAAALCRGRPARASRREGDAGRNLCRTALAARPDDGGILAARRGKRPGRNELVHQATLLRPEAARLHQLVHLVASPNLFKKHLCRATPLGKGSRSQRFRLTGQLMYRTPQSRSPPKQRSARGVIRMRFREPPPRKDQPRNASDTRQPPSLAALDRLLPMVALVMRMRMQAIRRIGCHGRPTRLALCVHILLIVPIMLVRRVPACSRMSSINFVPCCTQRGRISVTFRMLLVDSVRAIRCTLRPKSGRSLATI